MADTGTEIALSYNDRLLARQSTVGQQYNEKSSRHHRPFYDDYDTARRFIEQAVGDLTDIDLFGRQVLTGVFVRPNVTPTGFFLPLSEIKNDWWEHKVVLVLKCGPDAFSGKDGYLRGMYDNRPPGPGDWLFANANSGIQTSIMGDGGTRPRGKDHRGNEVDLFEWDGWPCRIVPDDCFLGRLPKPHQIV